MARKPSASKPPARKSAQPAVDPKLRARGAAAAKVAAHLREDGWQNDWTGVGDASRDKALRMHLPPVVPLSYEALSALYHGDDFAYKICTRLPTHALRQGFELHRAVEPTKLPSKKPAPPLGGQPVAPELGADASQDRASARMDADLAPGVNPEAEDAQAQAKELREALQKLGVAKSLAKAAGYGRAFGLGAVILGLEGAPESPAREDASQLRFLTVVDRAELRPVTWYTDPLAPKYGQVELYEIIPHNSGGQTNPKAMNRRIHETRLILFGGADTTRRERAKNESYDYSVLQMCYSVIQDTASAIRSVAHMLGDVSQTILKTPGVIDAVAEVGPEALRERIFAMDRTRSVARTLLLDKEEELSVVERGALTWIADVLDKFFLRLSAAADTPVEIMMGQSPAGLNATGAIALRWWNDTVHTWRTQELEPLLLRLVRVMSRSLFGDSVDHDEWCVTWPSLWQATPEEEAAQREKIANVDKIYVDMNAVMAEEVTRTRWGSGKFDPTPNYLIDLEARQASLEAEAMAAMQLPPPPGTEILPPGPNLGDPRGAMGADGKPALPPNDLTLPARGGKPSGRPQG